VAEKQKILCINAKFSSHAPICDSYGIGRLAWRFEATSAFAEFVI